VNCDKRGIECTYDETVRRRGPGKRTKEMRDRSARETEAGGLSSSSFADPQPLYDEHANADLGEHEHDHLHEHVHQQQEHDEHNLTEHQDVIDHGELILDPALAHEGGHGDQGAADVMNVVGALKEAGMLGQYEHGMGGGAPNTLAEMGDIGDIDIGDLGDLGDLGDFKELRDYDLGQHRVEEPEPEPEPLDAQAVQLVQVDQVDQVDPVDQVEPVDSMEHDVLENGLGKRKELDDGEVLEQQDTKRTKVDHLGENGLGRIGVGEMSYGA